MSPMMDASTLPEAGPIPAEPHRLADVPGALARVHEVGEYIAVDAPETEMGRELYTTAQQNNDGTNNHFQGLQRLNDGRHFVISGGNWRPEPRGSEIYVGQMGSTAGTGPWLSNLTRDGRVPADDRIVLGVTVDSRLWHAGGMDVCGPVLAVAVEHHGGIGSMLLQAGRGARADESAVHFFDMSDPLHPSRFPGRIHRDGVKAGAVALTRLPSGHYLCGVWSDSDALPVRLDLYVSRSDAGFDGRFVRTSTWTPNNRSPAQRAFNFQAVNFVRDTSGDLYLLGFGVDGDAHAVEIYRVSVAGVPLPEEAASSAAPSQITVERLPAHRIELRCDMRQADLRGASGAFLDDGLIVYAGAQYRGSRRGDPVRFAEFRGPLAPVPDVTLNTAWVELYAGALHRGARLTLKDLPRNGTIADYKDVRVGRRHFGDLARSARYQLPLGLDYVLFEHHDFRKPIIRLRGTGRVEVEPDFTVLAERVSSSRHEATA